MMIKRETEDGMQRGEPAVTAMTPVAPIDPSVVPSSPSTSTLSLMVENYLPHQLNGLHHPGYPQHSTAAVQSIYQEYIHSQVSGNDDDDDEELLEREEELH